MTVAETLWSVLAALMMKMMKLPILPCAEKKLVLSTAPKHEITPTKTVTTENGPISRGSQSEVRCLHLSSKNN